MFYPLASTIFPTLADMTNKHCAFKCVTYMYTLATYVSNTEFCLSIALGNEMNMASLTVLFSK